MAVRPCWSNRKDPGTAFADHKPRSPLRTNCGWSQGMATSGHMWTDVRPEWKAQFSPWTRTGKINGKVRWWPGEGSQKCGVGRSQQRISKLMSRIHFGCVPKSTEGANWGCHTSADGIAWVAELCSPAAKWGATGSNPKHTVDMEDIISRSKGSCHLGRKLRISFDKL